MRNISVFGWVVILVVSPLLLRWLLTRKKAPSGGLTDLGRLRGACFGDQGKAERLIQYEKKRAPGIDHAEAVRRALERLESDRRS